MVSREIAHDVAQRQIGFLFCGIDRAKFHAIAVDRLATLSIKIEIEYWHGSAIPNFFERLEQTPQVARRHPAISRFGLSAPQDGGQAPWLAPSHPGRGRALISASPLPSRQSRTLSCRRPQAGRFHPFVEMGGGISQTSLPHQFVPLEARRAKNS